MAVQANPRASVARRVGKALQLVAIFVALFWSLAPIWWMLVTSFKTPLEAIRLIPTLLPEHPTPENYLDLAGKSLPFFAFFLNTVISCLATAMFALLLGAPAACALSRGRFLLRCAARSCACTAVTATAVYVTHDQVEALTTGDRIVVMKAGRIQQVGTPDQLYDAPVNRFVASFIGTPAMGFLTCRIERVGETVELVTASARIGVSPEQAHMLGQTRSGHVSVGIRPERLALDDGSAKPAEWTVHGIADVVEVLGAEQYVHFSTEGGALTARVPRDHPVRVQQPVAFAGASRHLYLFDHETGQRLR